MREAYLLGCAALFAATCGTTYEATESSYQRAMDPVRIRHIDYVASLISEFSEKTGRMPLADRVQDKRITVFITNRQVKGTYLEQAARLQVVVLSADDLKADLEKGLGRTIDLPSDPQNFASFAPNLYVYDVDKAHACVYGHLFFEVPGASLVELTPPRAGAVNRYYKYEHCSVHSLVIDAAVSTQSPDVEADRVSLELLTWPETKIHGERRDRYAVAVSVYAAADSPRGRLAAIEVSEAALEVRDRDAEVRKLALSTVAADWSKEPGPQWGRFMLPQSKTPLLDVDFRRLEEIRFRLRFTGLYVSGERREYWLERYLKPKIVFP